MGLVEARPDFPEFHQKIGSEFVLFLISAKGKGTRVFTAIIFL